MIQSKKKTTTNKNIFAIICAECFPFYPHYLANVRRILFICYLNSIQNRLDYSNLSAISLKLNLKCKTILKGETKHNISFVSCFLFFFVNQIE